MLNKIILLAIVSVVTACGAQSSTRVDIVKFEDVLNPYYETALASKVCDNWRNVNIHVFDQQDQIISFRYSLCNLDAEGEMVDFSYKSKFFILEDHIFGKYKYLTPDVAFKINPNANKYTYLDHPIFGVTKLGIVSVEEHLKNRKTFHKADWGICKIKKLDQHIWWLENPSFKEVPTQNYTIDKYDSFKEWKLNHDEDKAKYREKYGEQMLTNRACANEQQFWYVAKDGILITIPSPANFVGGVDPASITYINKG